MPRSVARRVPSLVFGLIFALASREGGAQRTPRLVVDLEPGDACNVPIGIYRGFRHLEDDPDGLLMAIVGGPDTGKVDWHPSVVTEARKTGLSVDDDGNLIVEKPAA